MECNIKVNLREIGREFVKCSEQLFRIGANLRLFNTVVILESRQFLEFVDY
jgi:hypothetical protein